MKSVIDRRDFLRASFASIAGASLLPASEKSRLLSGLGNLTITPGSPKDEDYWKLVKSHYRLEPDLFYLNNGSLGPSPDIVIDATEEYRRLLDAYPSKYMWGGWNDEKEKVREKAAKLLNAQPDEIALTHNTTEGLNLVAHSLELEPGDEVIINDHEHQTGVIPFKHFQESRGVKVVRPVLPIMPESPEELLDVFRKTITPKTKVILICHMVNTNGMILPVKEVCAMARERGILVVVDAAQSCAMIDVDVEDIGCDFLATSAHKWLHSPKGLGIFYVRKDKQKLLKPLIVSAGYYNSDSARKFENYNTRNLPELLGLGSALDFHNMLGGENKAARIYELKHYLREQVADVPFLRLKCPESDELSAGITSVEMIDVDVRKVANTLESEYKIVCRPIFTHGINGLRVSHSIFNLKRDLDYLIHALKEIRDGLS